MNPPTWISWKNAGQRFARVGFGQDVNCSLVKIPLDCHELSHITLGADQFDSAKRETQEQPIFENCGDEVSDELTYRSGTGSSTAWCPTHVCSESAQGQQQDFANFHDQHSLETDFSKQWSDDRANDNLQCLVNVFKQACSA